MIKKHIYPSKVVSGHEVTDKIMMRFVRKMDDEDNIILPFTYFGQRQGEWQLTLDLEDSSGQQASQSTIIVVDISEPETLNVSSKDEPKATTEITEVNNRGGIFQKNTLY